MQKMFHHILVPVQLNRKTEAVIGKAVAFANKVGGHLHLLFINEQGLLTEFADLFRNSSTRYRIRLDRESRVMLLRKKFQQEMSEGLKLFAAIKKGNREQVIEKYTAIQSIDMILLDEPAKFFDDPANRLVNKTNCPVLSMTHTLKTEHFKNIILPLEGHLPVNKIRVAVYLAKQFNSSIHLLSLESTEGRDDLSGMKKAFRVLKENTDVPLVCTTLTGHSLSRSSFQYAQTLQSGLIVLSPGAESLLPGTMSNLFKRFTQGVLRTGDRGKVPVITI
jgi:hypothetical protein